MSTARRAVVGAALCAVLAACTSLGGTNPQRPYDGLAFDISEVPEELRVPRPKDLRGIPVCDLLDDAQLADLGLRPDSAAKAQASTVAVECQWTWLDDPLNYASAGAATDQQNPVLPGLYVRREVLAIFEPLVIAGYPGVRANLNHDGSCEIGIATADDQMLSLSDNAAGRPMADPCARPRRMAELILPTLPPRR